jgi:putative transposase
VIALAKIAILLGVDALRIVILGLYASRSLVAENLFLRRQLALYKERGVQPQRIDAATRVSLVLLSKLFDWRDALMVVRPETLIRWHRAGFRLFWRCKPLTGRPPIAPELRALQLSSVLGGLHHEYSLVTSAR